MAKCKGRCTNYDGCELAESKTIQEADSTNFVCSECGKPLTKIQEKKKPGPDPRLGIIIAAVVLLLALIGGAAWYFTSEEETGPTPIPVEALVLNDDSIEVSSLQLLNVLMTPKEADANLKWSSSNAEVVAVDDKGGVNCLQAGTAVITVTDSATQVSASATITVFEPHEQSDCPIEQITLEDTRIHVGEELQMIPMTEPISASISGFTWSISNPAIAKISEDGALVGVKVGATVLTVVEEKSQKTAVAKITVLKADGSKKGRAL